MNSIITIVVITSALVAARQDSNGEPVLPGLDLRHHLVSSDIACLFICNMCFDLGSAEEGYCANKVCDPLKCNTVDLVWVGLSCKYKDLVGPFVSPKYTLSEKPDAVRNQEKTD